MINTGLLTPGSHRAAELLDDRAVARAVLLTEAAWVAAQSRLGLVPEDIAHTCREAVDRVTLDEVSLNRLAVASEGGGNPVIPLLADYRAAVKELHGSPVGAVHKSLTSQDVMDTALALVLKAAQDSMVSDLRRTGDALAGLVERHAETVMVGRTLTQHALPISFGLKAASWLAGVDDAARDVFERAHLPVSYGGASGTLAAGMSLCDQGGGADETAERLFTLIDYWAEELGLAVPDQVWHTDRVPVLRVAGALAETTAALGRMANDVLLMSRPEVGELREPTAPGRGVSSAMPQKQNPVLSVLLKRTALAAPHLLGHVNSGAAAAVDERPDGGWHAEWPALRELAVLTTAAASHAAELTEGLTVNAERMAHNLRDAGTGVMAERLSAALTPVLSESDGSTAKQRVQAAVREHPVDAEALADHLTDLVMAEGAPSLPEGVNPQDRGSVGAWLGQLLDPRGYLGATQQLCTRAVKNHRERLIA